MKTRTLMISSSAALAIAGLLALFAPEELLGTPGSNPTWQVILQLLGALYFAMAFINWTAKDSRIGGIYLRPVSLGNFAHFLVGALVLGKYALSNSQNFFILAAMSIYAIFAYFFWWLVFRASGLESEDAGQS
jgi:hypothetical protein